MQLGCIQTVHTNAETTDNATTNNLGGTNATNKSNQ